MTAKNGARRERLYIIGIILCVIALLGTLGAFETDGITAGEAIWQSCVFGIGAVWFLKMSRIEERRACRN